MTILVVQCRISSTRLPGKALLELGNKTVLDWTLAAMKKVRADKYFVATDRDSFEQLKEIAGRNGFDPDSFVQYIIDDINRRTQALGVSPLIG